MTESTSRSATTAVPFPAMGAAGGRRAAWDGRMMDVIGMSYEGPCPGRARTYRMPLPRLTLTEVSRGPLDGAWWPRCHALELELPALAGWLDPRFGTATHVTVDDCSWPYLPHSVMTPCGAIDVEGTEAEAEAHAITLFWGTGGRCVLLVIPPDEPAGAASRMLAAAADPRNPLTAPQLLDLNETGPPGEGRWHSDRGRGV